MIKDMLAHAEREYPRESCGLVVSTPTGEQYFPCRNLAQDEGAIEGPRFDIDPRDQVAARRLGAVVAVVHSHPDGTTRPSVADQVGCNKSKVPWHIVSWPQGQHNVIQPNDDVLPLLGRDFVHGVVDCYTAIRDFYALHGIDIPDYARPDDWWHKGLNLYEDQVREAGFYPVSNDELPQPGDVLFMQIRGPVVNHGAVYLGDNQIYHHLPRRLSMREVYGEYFLKSTRSTWRHKLWQPSIYTGI